MQYSEERNFEVIKPYKKDFDYIWNLKRLDDDNIVVNSRQKLELLINQTPPLIDKVYKIMIIYLSTEVLTL